MNYEEIYISGQVINAKTEQGLYNYRVEAWDKDQKYNDLLGVCQTDKYGNFQMYFDQSYFREQYPETAPDLFFRVFKGKNLLKSTEDEVMWDAQSKTHVVIPVDLMDADRQGTDYVKAEQAYNLVDFFVRSDFKGFFKQTRDKTYQNANFVKDMFANSFSTMKFQPLQMHVTPVNKVVNQDVNSAITNLEDNNVEVNEVLEYQPGLNTNSFKEISPKPFDLKKGEKVNLYQQNGTVKYYTIVKTPATNEEMLIQVSEQKNEITKLQEEVKKSQSEVTLKDQQIEQLTKDLESMKVEQNRIIETLRNTPSINTDNLRSIDDIND